MKTEVYIVHLWHLTYMKMGMEGNGNTRTFHPSLMYFRMYITALAYYQCSENSYCLMWYVQSKLRHWRLTWWPVCLTRTSCMSLMRLSSSVVRQSNSCVTRTTHSDTDSRVVLVAFTVDVDVYNHRISPSIEILCYNVVSQLTHLLYIFCHTHWCGCTTSLPIILCLIWMPSPQVWSQMAPKFIRSTIHLISW